MASEILNSSFKGTIPEIYDLFFLQNINQEVEYLNEIIQQTVKYPYDTLLDCGCGTGAHDECFAKLGYSVTGIDISTDMLKFAKKNHANPNVEYLYMDCTDISIDKQYDMAISLSHVIGYQYENLKVYAMLSDISKSLKIGETVRKLGHDQPL